VEEEEEKEEEAVGLRGHRAHGRIDDAITDGGQVEGREDAALCGVGKRAIGGGGGGRGGEGRRGSGAAELTAESTTPLPTVSRSRVVRMPLCMGSMMCLASSSILRSESSAFISARMLALARERIPMMWCCPNMKSIVPCTAADASGLSSLIFNICRDVLLELGLGG